MKKIVILLVALLLLATACTPAAQPGDNGAPPPADEQITIAVITKIIDPFFQTLIDYCVQRGNELGVNIIYSAASHVAAIEEQIAIVQNMVAMNVDAIIISPIDSIALVSAVEEAYAAGIPVIAFDNEFDADAVARAGLPPIPFVGIDNEASAYLSAMYLVNYLGGEGRVAILEGLTGADNAILRANGGRRAFESAPGIEIVASQAADWDTERGYAVMTNILQANPDIVGVFSSADPMSYGALRAIEDAGRKGQIAVASFDGLRPAIELIAAGELLATLDQNAPGISAMAVDVAMKGIRGETLEPFYVVEPILITRANYAQFLN